jgi:hypothetical protein
MAIDPNIALGVKPIAPLDITKLQQLRNLAMQEQATQQSIAASQAQEALARAQLPGVQATSETQVRAAQFNRDVMGNSKEFTNPDGSPNITKFVNFASSRGFLKEAQGIAATDLDNLGKSIGNARSEQDRQVALNNFLQTGQSYVSMLLHSTPENQRSGALKSYSDFMNNVMPGSGQQVAQLFGEVDNKTGMVKVNPERVRAVREATINAATQEQMTLDRAQKFYTAEGRDPKSQQSVGFRNFINQQTGGSVKIPENVSVFDALMNPVYRGSAEQYISAQITPSALRAQAVGGAVQTQATMANYDAAIKAIESVPAQLLPTRLGTIGSEAFKKFVSQNPSLAGLETAIQVHNNQFPSDVIDPMRQSLDEIRAKLQAGRKQLENVSAGQIAISQTGVLPSAPGAVVPEPAQRARDMQSLGIIEAEVAKAVTAGKMDDARAATREANKLRKSLGMPEMPMPSAAPAAAAPKVVRMIDSKGKLYDIPENKVNDAIKAGFKRVGQ